MVPSTKFFDVNGVEIMANSRVRYSDDHHGVINEEGYIVKNLVNIWEVRNVSQQTGNDLANVKDLLVIGTIQ